MQRHILLINYAFSSTTQSTQSTYSGSGQSFIVNSNDYYLNNVSGLNLGTVNPTNVRTYLNDEKNSKIINDFFSYLTGNTNQEQFTEIFYSDQKLSDVFNNYYGQSVGKGQASSVYYINEQLTGTTSFIHTYSNFNWNGYSNVKYLTGATQEIYDSTRFVESKTTLTTFSIDESYYIPVFIKKNFKDINKSTYEFEVILKSLGVNQDVDNFDYTYNYMQYSRAGIGIQNI